MAHACGLGVFLWRGAPPNYGISRPRFSEQFRSLCALSCGLLAPAVAARATGLRTLLRARAARSMSRSTHHSPCRSADLAKPRMCLHPAISSHARAPYWPAQSARSAMGTAAGFFGITYQGAVNGLASITLSIFNMVRAATLPAGRRDSPKSTARLTPLTHTSRGSRHGRTTPMTARG